MLNFLDISHNVNRLRSDDSPLHKKINFMLKGISTYEFRTQFKTADDCYTYLFDLKWKNGYKCSKCGHNKSYKGRTK